MTERAFVRLHENNQLAIVMENAGPPPTYSYGALKLTSDGTEVDSFGRDAKTLAEAQVKADEAAECAPCVCEPWTE